MLNLFLRGCQLFAVELWPEYALLVNEGAAVVTLAYFYSDYASLSSSTVLSRQQQLVALVTRFRIRGIAFCPQMTVPPKRPPYSHHHLKSNIYYSPLKKTNSPCAICNRRPPSQQDTWWTWSIQQATLDSLSQCCAYQRSPCSLCSPSLKRMTEFGEFLAGWRGFGFECFCVCERG